MLERLVWWILPSVLRDVRSAETNGARRFD
jgi:hypothetical protein